ncbi:MAG: molybdopterin-dependent oxidoreductase, partial [Actinomycetota bacterium]|nr:molybdopterin-dependent oxidoreductase [Actinomycetota bacterium]
TGGSSTVRIFYDPVRAMAATARSRLIAAAAQQWGLSRASLTTSDGSVRAPDGRSATYASLTLAAASPQLAGISASPKPFAQHRLVGKPTARVDALDIVTGRKKFIMDIMPTIAKATMLKRPPTVAGTIRMVNNAKTVRAMAGVIAVVPLDTGIAVVAETFEQARAGADALDVTWGPGPIDGEGNDTLFAKLRSQISPFAIPPLGALTIEGEFTWAAANHAMMETNCAVAAVKTDSAEIWTGSQGPIVIQEQVSIKLGLPLDSVKVHVVPPGGGFGRRGWYDAEMEAVLVSQAVGMPVRVMWHRTDDMRHGRVRPPVYQKIRATVLLDEVISYEQRTASVATDVSPGFGEILTATIANLPPGAKERVGENLLSQTIYMLMVSSPYNFGVYDKLLTELPNGMPTAAYRSIHCPPTRGSEEIIVDEIAAAIGMDPLAFRMKFVKYAEGRTVLSKVGDLAGWGKSMPKGFAQGLGYHKESKSHSACVVELDGTDPMNPHVTKATIVVDVGTPVNPLGLEAQVQGCLAEAVSLTLRAGLHFEKGLPLEGSYHDYHWALQAQYPRDVTIYVIPGTGSFVGGAGEVTVTAPTGAIANAFARATGIKPRNFPLNFPVDFTPYAPGSLPAPPYVDLDD